ncbi:MAG: endopeptidase La, partial [Acutalibacteraceae bacterium]
KLAKIYESMKVIALRGLVIFPGMRLQFELGRKKSINALIAAVEKQEKVFLVAQKKMSIENPDFSQLCLTGVVANIDQVVRTPDNGIVRIAVEGVERAVICQPHKEKTEYLEADVMTIDSPRPAADEIYIKGMSEVLKDLFDEYADASMKLAKDIIFRIFETSDLGELTDLIASNAVEDFEMRQELLDEKDPLQRAHKLCEMLRDLSDIAQVKAEIEEKVQERIDKSQREYYLREEMTVISKELGDDEDRECDAYRKAILEAGLPSESEEKLLKEVAKLSKMQMMSPEANVVRAYLDECLALPWSKFDEENSDIEKARKILDKNHYGLEKVKNRFIEMLSVLKLGAQPNNQILCLIGPPGVGKTSIARSAAKAMGRSFARVSLGGVSDEAEIRGHRKTYIGSMPGRILNAVKQAGSSNALILLDEIDKLGKDYKGDPASALLEVLDGEQNHAFVDHYIELPFDLSHIIFVTTANSASTIPEPLYDRMEKIEIDSYTFEEKVKIATKHLVGKQLKNYALTSKQLSITKGAIEEIIEKYTREAGVRMLEQYIGTICRKAAVRIVGGEEKVTVGKKDVESYLSKPRYLEKAQREDRIGVVNGLAWTAVGGEMLEVETAVMDGTGKIEITGSLGDVMKESAKLAVSIVRGVCDEFKLDKEFYKNKDIHIHVPQGAVPKDGPSAGVTISTSLLSALSGRKVRGDVAMTGEVSLTGRVLPIGGLKEKSMAAYKNKIHTVIIPEENVSDLCEVSDEVKKNVKFIPVKKLSDVFKNALI